MARPTNTHLILLCSYSDALENNSTVLHQIMLSVTHLWNRQTHLNHWTSDYLYLA